MKKVLIICLGGFSSSVFAKELAKFAKSKGVSYETKATFPVDGKPIAKDYDLIMISPQAAFEIPNFKVLNPNTVAIPPMVYGRMDAPKAFEIAEETFK